MYLNGGLMMSLDGQSMIVPAQVGQLQGYATTIPPASIIISQVSTAKVWYRQSHKGRGVRCAETIVLHGQTMETALHSNRYT